MTRATGQAGRALLAVLAALAITLQTANPAAAVVLDGRDSVVQSVPVKLTNERLVSLLKTGEHQDAPGVGSGDPVGAISQADLVASSSAAAGQWPGWAVTSASLVLQDLPGATLAVTQGTTIAVDPDAAGWGWSVNGGAMDLVTVLAHEYGHVAGFGDIEGGADLMSRVLNPGEQRTNSADRMYPAPEPDPEPAPADTTTTDPTATDPTATDPTATDPSATEAETPTDATPTEAETPTDATPTDATPTEAETPTDATADGRDPDRRDDGSDRYGQTDQTVTDPTTDRRSRPDDGSDGTDPTTETEMETPTDVTPTDATTDQIVTDPTTETGPSATETETPTDATDTTATDTPTEATTETAPTTVDDTPAADSSVWSLSMNSGADTLVFHRNGTVSFGSESRVLAELTEIHITGTAHDDVLTLDRSANDAAITVFFDGAEGFDVLATLGGGSIVSFPTDGSSGTLHLGATTVVYSNIEPITAGGTTSDVEFTLSGNDDQAVLESISGGLRLRSLNSSFEQTDFSNPTSSLTINGGDGNDSLTIIGAVALGGATLTINVEKIIAQSGANITAKEITLNAEQSTTGGPALDPDCLTRPATHCADVDITVDSATLTAEKLTLNASASVDPDETDATAYAAVVDSHATVNVTGTSSLNATAGDATITASSTVGPVTLNKKYGDAGIVTSAASVTIGGSAVVSASGNASLTSTSTVEVGAHPGSDAAKDEGTAGADGSTASFDAAVAVLTVNASAVSKITSTSRISVGGNLAVMAGNHATLSGVADAKNATSGAGISIAHLNQTTEAVIDSTSSTPTTAASLEILAEQEAAITATANAGKGGATQNNESANSPDRADGQSSTSDGAIDIAGALAVSVLGTSTKAHITGAKVTTTGAQTITATAKNTVGTTADAGTTDGSGGSSGLGLAIGVAVNVVDLVTEAFIGGGATLHANGITVSVQEPSTGKSRFDATSVSGKNSSGSASIAGSVAVNSVTSSTTAEVRGIGNSLNNADLALTAKADHKNAAKATAKQDGGSVGVGASVAISLINVSVRAGLAKNSVITGIKALNVNAKSTDDTTTETEGGAGGGSSASLTGVASIAISNVNTSASILAGPALSTSGAVTAKAEQTAKATTSAKGATTAGSGGSLAATISFALTSADHEVDSSIYRDVTAGGDVSMAADATSATSTSATASAAGAPDESSDSTGNNANQKADAKLSSAAGRSSGGANDSSTPAAENEDGTSVTVAAAIAFNLVTSTSTVLLAAGKDLTTTGGVVFVSRNNTDAKAAADGTSTGATSVGIGAGLAVNKVTLVNEASIGVGSTVHAKSLTLNAIVLTLGSDDTHAFEANAKAGATDGSGTLGVAGAFALNLVDADTLAVIHGDQTPSPDPAPGPGVVIAGSGAVSFQAGSKSADKALGYASQSGTGTVGIGAAFGLNLVDFTVYAGIDQVGDPTRGPPLTGAGTVTITATEDSTFVTEAQAGGGSGSVTIVPAIAITLATIRTSASLGASTTALTASSVAAQATQSVKASTTAKGDTEAGSSAGIGVSLALTVIDNVVADSGSARSIAASGAVSFKATQAVDVTTVAEASAKGASPSEGKDGGGKDVNEKADANLGKANESRNTNGGSTSTSSTPKAATNDDGGNSVSIAGAIAINVVKSTSRAWFGDGVVISAGGVVTLKSLANTDVSANAKGDSATDGSVGVGAGVAVNAVTIINRAVTGDATITATGLVLTAGLAGGDTNDVIRRWTGTSWEIVPEGKQLPGPSKNDLSFVRTNGGDEDGDGTDDGDDGLYKFDGSSWSMDTNVSLTGTVDTLPGSPSDGEYYYLTSEKDGHPANSVWKRDSGAWVFVTKFSVSQKVELPRDQIEEGSWFRLTEQDGSHSPGFYKRKGDHTWEFKFTNAALTDGDHFPTAPITDQMFRLWEHEVTTTARAGASKSTSVGIAGALAIGILTSTTEAVVSPGATVTLTSSDVTVSALANELDRSTATSKAEVGSATGVGASVALQVIHDNVVRAEVADAAVLTGGASLSVDAFGFREVLTKAEGGTEGGTAVTPVVALLVSVNDQVKARLGTSSTAYVGSGVVTVRATHQNHVVTEGNAEAAGKSTAVGIDIAVNAVVGWDTLAEVARDVTGTGVNVFAVSGIVSEAKSVASAKGSDSSGDSGDQKANSQVNGSNNPNTQSTKSDTAGMPSSSGGTTGSNGANGANSQQSGQSGAQGSSTGVAAAIAVNWVVATSTARITANRTVTATTGSVTVRSTALVGANAFGLGSAIDLKKNGTRVGATIGLNVQDITNEAVIGTDAHVTGHGGIIVEATVPKPATDHNDFIVWSFAAAGGKSTSVAGSASVQILLLTTRARVGAGTELDAPAGDIKVGAYNPVRLQNLAISGALSTNSGTAIGAAFVVNWLEVTTTAGIESSTTAGDVTKVDASGAITVTAKSSLAPLVPDLPEPVKGKVDWLKLTSVAIAGGASSSGAAVTGGFIVDIFNFDTRAWVADGAQVNQEGAIGGSGQTISVLAGDDIRVVNVGGALALSQSSASVGLTAVIDIVNSNVRAWIGNSAKVRAGGSVTVEATASEDWFVIAVAGGGSASSAAVTGSVLVFVFNQGGSAPKVLASIGASEVHALGAVTVSAHRSASGPLSAGNLAIGGGSAGIGASAVVVVRSSVVEARVAGGSNIQAGGTGLLVSAVQSGDWKFIAVAGAGGNSAGVAGSVVVDVLSDTTKAHIDGGATVALPTTHVAVLAQDTTTVLSLAGVLAVGGTAGVGAGVDVEVITKDTQAWIGADATISATGNLTVDAKSKETITSISVGGGFGGTAAVNVNAAVSAINVTTKAFLADAGSAATAVVVTIDGSVRVAADENLTLNVIGGNISIGGTAGVGASVAVPVTTKNTHAWIGDFARVNAKGLTPVTVATGSYSVTTKDMRFAPADVNTSTNTITLKGHGFSNGDQVQYDAGCDVDGSPNCGSDGLVHRGIYYIVGATTNTFQVSLTKGGAPVNITDQGSTENQRFFRTDEANVPVDTTQRFNPQTAVSGNQITTPYSVGAADDDAVVYSSGGGAPIVGLIDGGTYYYKSLGGNTFQLLDKKSADGGTPIAISLTDPSGILPDTSGRGHSITKAGTAPAGDPSATGPRTIVSGSNAGFRGVAVTANNSDNIGAFGVGVSIGGTAGVSLAGAVAVNTIHTSAHIGASAHVNCGATCATNVAGAHVGQSVQVSAANQYYELGIAASLAIGGTAGIAVPVAVRVVGIDTYSYIGTGSHVNARNNIAVTANGKDTIVSVAVGAGGGTVGIAGTVAVTVLNVHTFACTGTPGSDAYKCVGTGPTLRADNNVVVSATDDTKMVLLTVAIAGGYVGVGAAVGVAVMNKTVQAYLGGGGAVTALAQGSAITGVSDGTVGTTGLGRQSFSGVIVRADSSEDIFGLVPAVAGGFVGVAGGVSVTLLTVLVKAFIGGGGTVDSSAGVNVSATDRFKSLTIAGGIAGGFVGVAGGVDIGVANNSVQAVLGSGLVVTADGDVEVFAVSKKDVSSFAVSFAGGFVGVAAAVSVWSIGTTPNGGYHAAAGGDDRGTWNTSTTYRQGDVVTDPADGKRYSAKADNVVGGPSPMNNPAKWLGETSALGRGDYVATEYYNKGDEVRDPFDDKYYTAREDGITGIAPHSDSSKWKEGGAFNSVNQGGEAAQGGGDGYKNNTLSGTTAAAAPAWVATTSYDAGNRVTFNGNSYSALVAITGSAANDNPENDTRWKVNSGSEDKTNQRIADQFGSVNSSISGAAPATNPGSDALGATPTGGTSATLNGTVIAGGHVRVSAIDRLLVLGVAGSGAVGAVGVGVSVLVLNIKSNTDAGIGSSAQVTAGAGGDGDVTVTATMDEDSVGVGFSGAAGAVGIAGQVVVINDTGTQRAHIDGGAQIKRAGGGVTIGSAANRHLENYSVGVAVGAIGAGVSVSVVNVSGDNIAETGTVTVGAVGTVKSFKATTTDNIDVTGVGVSVAGGAGAIGGVVTFVSLDGTAKASASPSGTVGSGGVGAIATGIRAVRVNTLNVTVGTAVAVGITAARANSTRHLESVVGGSATTTGAVDSKATATNSAVVRAPGVSVGTVSIGITVVFAVLAGHTSARAIGTVSGASHISVIATASNLADAKTVLASGSLVGLTGAWASAKVTSDAYIRAIAESGSSLGSLGAIAIKAQTQGDGNHAKGIIDSFSVGGLADLKAFVAIGHVLNETRATLDGVRHGRDTGHGEG